MNFAIPIAASRSCGTQKKRHTSSLSSAPKASLTLGAPLSGRKLVKAPSATSAARASILPRSAATTIGIGSAGGTSSLKPPGPRSPANTGRSASTASRTLLSGLTNGTPVPRSAITFDDDPSPGTKGPPEGPGHAAGGWGRTAGGRAGGG